MAKYHINLSGKANVCNAKVRPCAFSEHYASLKEAHAAEEKALQEKYSEIVKGLSKEKTPEAFDADDVPGISELLTSEEKADIAIFTGLIWNEGTRFGEPDEDSYYSSGRTKISTEMSLNLKALSVPEGGPMFSYDSFSTLEALNAGFKIKFIPGTLKQNMTYQFADTYSPSDEVEHIQAEVVLISPDGTKIKTSICSQESFSDVLRLALDSNKLPEPVMKGLRNAITLKASKQPGFNYFD